MSEFLQTTHGTINEGYDKLKKRMAEITNKVDDMVKTLGTST